MFYFVEKTSTKTSGTACAIWTKEDEDQALSSLHYVFASTMANPDAISCLGVVFGENGAIIRNEYWERLDTEPTPETEE